MADALSGVTGTATGATGTATSAAGPATSGLPLSQVSSVLGTTVTSLLSSVPARVMAFVDKWFPPERRAEWSERLRKFATERPKLAAFLLSHIALSGLPLALFVAMTITVAVFAIVAALLIALVGTLAFILFAVVAALAFLLPTLFFTTLVATFVFLWAMGAYYVVKWFNEEKVPGIHVGLVEGLKKEFMDFTQPDNMNQIETEALSQRRAPPEKTRQDSKPDSKWDSKPEPKQQEQPRQKSQAGTDSSQDKGQDKGQNKSPEKSQDKGQDKGQNKSPEKGQDKSSAQNGSARPKKLATPSQQQGGLDAVGKTTGLDGAAGGGLTKGVQGARQAVPSGVL